MRARTVDGIKCSPSVYFIRQLGNDLGKLASEIIVLVGGFANTKQVVFDIYGNLILIDNLYEFLLIIKCFQYPADRLIHGINNGGIHGACARQHH